MARSSDAWRYHWRSGSDFWICVSTLSCLRSLSDLSILESYWLVVSFNRSKIIIERSLDNATEGVQIRNKNFLTPLH